MLLAGAFVGCFCCGNLLPISVGAAACRAAGQLVDGFPLDFSSAEALVRLGRAEEKPILPHLLLE